MALIHIATPPTITVPLCGARSGIVQTWRRGATCPDCKKAGK